MWTRIYGWLAKSGQCGFIPRPTLKLGKSSATGLVFYFHLGQKDIISIDLIFGIWYLFLYFPQEQVLGCAHVEDGLGTEQRERSQVGPPLPLTEHQLLKHHRL